MSPVPQTSGGSTTRGSLRSSHRAAAETLRAVQSPRTFEEDEAPRLVGNSGRGSPVLLAPRKRPLSPWAPLSGFCVTDVSDARSDPDAT